MLNCIPNRKYIFILFFMFLFAVSSLWADNNILSNWNFEDWNDNELTVWAGSFSISNWTQSEDALTGNYSVKVPDGATARTLTQHGLTVPGDITYNAKIFVKGTGEVRVGIRQGGSTSVTYGDWIIITDADWTACTHTRIPSAGDQSGISIQTQNASNLLIGAAWYGAGSPPENWPVTISSEATTVTLSGDTNIISNNQTATGSYNAKLDAAIENIPVTFKLADFLEADIDSISSGNKNDLINAGVVINTDTSGEANLDITFAANVEKSGTLTVSISEASDSVSANDSAVLGIAVNTTPTPEYTLTITNPDSGTILVNGAAISDTTVLEGTVLNIEAVADGGYQFVEWSGDVVNIDNVSSAQTTITMNAAATITASFEESEANLLTNWNFEDWTDGDPVHWLITTGSNIHQVDTALVGNYAANWNRTASSSGYLEWITATMENGEDWYASILVKAIEGGAADITVGIKKPGDNLGVTYVGSDGFDTFSEWVRYDVTRNVTAAGADGGIRIRSSNATGGGIIIGAAWLGKEPAPANWPLTDTTPADPEISTPSIISPVATGVSYDTNATEITVSGTATSGEDVLLYLNNEYISTAENIDGTWSFNIGTDTPQLKINDINIIGVIADSEGVRSETAAISIFIDTAGPVAPADLNLNPTITESATPTITWAAFSDSLSIDTYLFVIGNEDFSSGDTYVVTTTSVSIDTALIASETYYIIIKGIDELGNVGNFSTPAVTIEILEPSPEEEYNAIGGIGDSETISVGNILDNDTQYIIKQNDVDTVIVKASNAAASGTYSISIDFSDTGNVLKINRVQPAFISASDTSYIKGSNTGMFIEIKAYNESDVLIDNFDDIKINLSVDYSDLAINEDNIRFFRLNTIDNIWYDVMASWQPGGIVGENYNINKAEKIVSVDLKHLSHYYLGEGQTDTLTVVINENILSDSIYTDSFVTVTSVYILGDTEIDGDTLTGFTIKNNGNLDTNLINAVELWRDVNSNSVWDEGDLLVDSLTWDAGSEAWINNLLDTYISITGDTFVVTAQFGNLTAAVGDTFQALIPANSINSVKEEAGPIENRINTGILIADTYPEPVAPEDYGNLLANWHFEDWDEPADNATHLHNWIYSTTTSHILRSSDALVGNYAAHFSTISGGNLTSTPDIKIENTGMHYAVLHFKVLNVESNEARVSVRIADPTDGSYQNASYTNYSEEGWYIFTEERTLSAGDSGGIRIIGNRTGAGPNIILGAAWLADTLPPAGWPLFEPEIPNPVIAIPVISGETYITNIFDEITVSGTAEEAETIYLFVNGITADTKTLSDSSWNFSIFPGGDTGLKLNEYTLIEVQSDTAGYTSSKVSINILVDTAGPIPSTLSFENTFDTEITLEWDVFSDSVSVDTYIFVIADNEDFIDSNTYIINGNSISLAGDSALTSDSTYWVVIKGIDALGNKGEFSDTVSFEVYPPMGAAVITSPAVFNETNTVSIVVSGTYAYMPGVDSITLYINNIAADTVNLITNGSDSIFSFTVTGLPNDTITIYTRVYNPSIGVHGMVSNELIFIYDTAPPIPSNAVFAGAANRTPEITFNAFIDSIPIVLYEIEISKVDNFTSDTNIYYSDYAGTQVVESLDTGTYYLRVRATDRLGHQSDYSVTTSFEIIAPVIIEGNYLEAAGIDWSFESDNGSWIPNPLHQYPYSTHQMLGANSFSWSSLTTSWTGRYFYTADSFPVSPGIENKAGIWAYTTAGAWADARWRINIGYYDESGNIIGDTMVSDTFSLSASGEWTKGEYIHSTPATAKTAVYKIQAMHDGSSGRLSFDAAYFERYVAPPSISVPVSSGQYDTTATSIKISGTAETGDNVIIFVNDAEEEQYAIAAGTAWSFDNVTLIDNSLNKIEVIRETGSNVSDTATIYILVDNRGPIPVSFTIEDTFDTDPIISWNLFSDSVNIVQYELWIDTDNTFSNPDIYFSADTSIQIETGLQTIPPTIYYVKIKAVDEFDNEGSFSDIISFTALPELPIPAIASPTSDYFDTNADAISITGTIGGHSEIDTVSIFVNGQLWESVILTSEGADSIFSFELNDLPNDYISIYVAPYNKVHGYYGIASDTIYFLYDTEGPVPSTLSLSPTTDTMPEIDFNDFTDSSSIVLYEIEIANNSGFIGSTKYYSATSDTTIPAPGLAVGTYYVRVSAKDSLQNWGNYSSTAVLEILPPLAGGLLADEGIDWSFEGPDTTSWTFTSTSSGYPYSYSDYNGLHGEKIFSWSSLTGSFSSRTLETTAKVSVTANAVYRVGIWAYSSATNWADARWRINLKYYDDSDSEIKTVTSQEYQLSGSGSWTLSQHSDTAPENVSTVKIIFEAMHVGSSSRLAFDVAHFDLIGFPTSAPVITTPVTANETYDTNVFDIKVSGTVEAENIGNNLQLFINEVQRDEKLITATGWEFNLVPDSGLIANYLNKIDIVVDSDAIIPALSSINILVDTAGPVSSDISFEDTFETQPLLTWDVFSDSVNVANYIFVIDTSLNFATADTYEVSVSSVQIDTELIASPPTQYYVRIKAIDELGNAGDWASASFKVVPYITAPVITSPLTISDTNAEEIIITGTYTGDVDSLVVVVNGIFSDTFNISDNTFEIIISNSILPNDWITLKFRTFHSDGYYSDYSDSFYFLYDNTGPIPSTISFSNTTNNTPEISWSDFSDSSDIALYEIAISALGDWSDTELYESNESSYQFVSALDYGEYGIKIRAKDNLDNWGSYSNIDTFEIIAPGFNYVQNPYFNEWLNDGSDSDDLVNWNYSSTKTHIKSTGYSLSGDKSIEWSVPSSAADLVQTNIEVTGDTRTFYAEAWIYLLEEVDNNYIRISLDIANPSDGSFPNAAYIDFQNDSAGRWLKITKTREIGSGENGGIRFRAAYGTGGSGSKILIGAVWMSEIVSPDEWPDDVPPADIELISVRPSSEAAILSWVQNNELDFDYYKVFYSSDTVITDVRNATLYSSIENREDTELAILNLDNDLQYWFAVTAVDIFGNEDYLPASVLTDTPLSSLADDTPPVAINDLEIVNISPATVTMTWTTPYDDNQGQPYRYDIRYSQLPINNINDFLNASQAEGISEKSVLTYGSQDTFTVKNLTPDKQYYFRIISYDVFDNRAGLSNSVDTVTEAGFASTVVISEVFPHGPNWAELYNPTSSDINLDGWKLQVYQGSYDFTAGDVIPAFGYYLIASETYISDVEADVVSSGMNITADGSNSYVELQNESSNIVDAVAWALATSKGEGTILGTLQEGSSYERKALYTSTAANLASGGSHVSYGNAFDMNDNSKDFVAQSAINPQNKTSQVKFPANLPVPSIPSIISPTAYTETNVTTINITVDVSDNNIGETLYLFRNDIEILQVSITGIEYTFENVELLINDYNEFYTVAGDSIIILLRSQESNKINVLNDTAGPILATISYEDTTVTQPIFKWTAFSDSVSIDTYIFVIADNADFNNPDIYYVNSNEVQIDTVLISDPITSYYIKIMAIDSLENESEWSDSASFRAIPHINAPAIISPALFSETNSQTVIFTGTFSPVENVNSIVLFLNGLPFDTVTLQSGDASDSIFTFEINDFPNDYLTVWLAAYEETENYYGAKTATYDFLYDTLGPEATTISVSNTTDITPRITWTAFSDSIGVDYYEIALSMFSNFSDSNIITVYNNSYKFLDSLLYEEYYIKIRAVDKLGNIGDYSNVDSFEILESGTNMLTNWHFDDGQSGSSTSREFTGWSWGSRGGVNDDALIGEKSFMHEPYQGYRYLEQIDKSLEVGDYYLVIYAKGTGRIIPGIKDADTTVYSDSPTELVNDNWTKIEFNHYNSDVTQEGGVSIGLERYAAGGEAIYIGAVWLSNTPPPGSWPDATPPSDIVLNNLEPVSKGAILDWQKSAAHDFSHYNVYYSNLVFQNVNNARLDTQITDINTNQRVFSGLSNNVQYWFAVTAVDIFGNENMTPSSIFTDTPLLQYLDDTPPERVADLSSIEILATTIKLQWTSPVDNERGNSHKYDLRYSNSPITNKTEFFAANQASGITSKVPLSAGEIETFLVKGLTPDTQYYFALISYDVFDNESELSNLVTDSTTLGIAQNIVVSQFCYQLESSSDYFIELYNPTSEAIDISGWKLARRSGATASQSNIYTINSGAAVLPYGYYLLATDAFSGSDIAEPDEVFPAQTFSNDNTLILYNEFGGIVDLIGFGSIEKVVVYKGEAPAPSPGTRNALLRKAIFESTAESMTTGEHSDLGNAFNSANNNLDFVVISGIMPRNSLTLPKLSYGIIKPDDIAPESVSTLISYDYFNEGAVLLKWKPVRDYDNEGTPYDNLIYIIKYSDTDIITDTDFNDAINATNNLIGSYTDNYITYIVENLTSGDTYYFALKTVDRWGNYSDISNVAVHRAYAMPPQMTSNIVSGQDGIVPTTQIEIEFTKSMNIDSVMDNFSIIPQVDSTIVWDGRRKFTVNANWAVNTEYEIKIRANAQDYDGLATIDGNNNNFAEGSPYDDYIIKFTTVETYLAAPDGDTGSWTTGFLLDGDITVFANDASEIVLNIYNIDYEQFAIITYTPDDTGTYITLSNIYPTVLSSASNDYMVESSELLKLGVKIKLFDNDGAEFNDGNLNIAFNYDYFTDETKSKIGIYKDLEDVANRLNLRELIDRNNFDNTTTTDLNYSYSDTYISIDVKKVGTYFFGGRGTLAYSTDNEPVVLRADAFSGYQVVGKFEINGNYYSDTLQKLRLINDLNLEYSNVALRITLSTDLGDSMIYIAGRVSDTVWNISPNEIIIDYDKAWEIIPNYNFQEKLYILVEAAFNDVQSGDAVSLYIYPDYGLTLTNSLPYNITRKIETGKIISFYEMATEGEDDIVINEVVITPKTNFFRTTDGSMVSLRFVELLNKTDKAVDISNWGLKVYAVATGGVIDTRFGIDEETGNDITFADIEADSAAYSLQMYFNQGGNINRLLPGEYMMIYGGWSFVQNLAIQLIDYSMEDDTEAIKDQVAFGSFNHSSIVDGTANNAPAGSSTDATDESISRYPDGQNTGNNSADFRKMTATPGRRNAIIPVVPTIISPFNSDSTDTYYTSNKTVYLVGRATPYSMVLLNLNNRYLFTTVVNQFGKYEFVLIEDSGLVINGINSLELITVVNDGVQIISSTEILQRTIVIDTTEPEISIISPVESYFDVEAQSRNINIIGKVETLSPLIEIYYILNGRDSEPLDIDDENMFYININLDTANAGVNNLKVKSRNVLGGRFELDIDFYYVRIFDEITASDTITVDTVAFERYGAVTYPISTSSPLLFKKDITANGNYYNLDLKFNTNDKMFFSIIKPDTVSFDTGTSQMLNYGTHSANMITYNLTDGKGRYKGNNEDIYDTIVLSYYFDDIVDIDNYGIFRYNDTETVWVYLDTGVERPSDKIIQVRLRHLSTYMTSEINTIADYASDLNNFDLYPSPFVPNDNNPRTGVHYDGSRGSGIYISGLMEETVIEIYDISGKIVFNTNVDQGYYQWNVRNNDNNPVASGVYILVARQGRYKVVRKFAIIR